MLPKLYHHHLSNTHLYIKQIRVVREHTLGGGPAKKIFVVDPRPQRYNHIFYCTLSVQ